jgi:hypothetical protein
MGLLARILKSSGLTRGAPSPPPFLLSESSQLGIYGTKPRQQPLSA